MKNRSHFPWFSLILIGAITAVIWWSLLPEHKREFYRNLVRQVPDLPGRYVI
ncbi:MAG: hypothetical protein HGA28_07915 [Anaerolineaceae bacterium]|jgi:hypothetical protein|nr:hypothetical protein [Anaerolineaceae bacterium]